MESGVKINNVIMEIKLDVLTVSKLKDLNVCKILIQLLCAISSVGMVYEQQVSSVITNLRLDVMSFAKFKKIQDTLVLEIQDKFQTVKSHVGTESLMQQKNVIMVTKLDVLQIACLTLVSFARIGQVEHLIVFQYAEMVLELLTKNVIMEENQDA